MAGRLLISLACALLVVMPWTEYFCRFDKFLRGGNDLELGLLALITFYCLVLLLARHLSQGIAKLLATLQFFSLIRDRRKLTHSTLSTTLEIFGLERVHSIVSSPYSLPLQI
jgi:hypothetical protein